MSKQWLVQIWAPIRNQITNTNGVILCEFGSVKSLPTNDIIIQSYAIIDADNKVSNSWEERIVRIITNSLIQKRAVIEKISKRFEVIIHELASNYVNVSWLDFSIVKNIWIPTNSMPALILWYFHGKWVDSVDFHRVNTFQPVKIHAVGKCPGNYSGSL